MSSDANRVWATGVVHDRPSQGMPYEDRERLRVRLLLSRQRCENCGHRWDRHFDRAIRACTEWRCPCKGWVLDKFTAEAKELKHA